MQLIKRAVVAATIITGIGVFGATGTALAGPCEARSTSAAFAPWGDQNQYFVANGGTFEDGATPWSTWGGARSGTGQNPFGYAGRGAKAMRMPAWSGAQSPSICVFHNEESLRFSYKAPFAGATMQVYVEVANEDGYAYTDTYVTASSRRWDVTPIIDLPNLRNPDGQQWVTIYLMPLDDGGTWLVDDVMIDPWVAR